MLAAWRMMSASIVQYVEYSIIGQFIVFILFVIIVTMVETLTWLCLISIPYRISSPFGFNIFPWHMPPPILHSYAVFLLEIYITCLILLLNLTYKDFLLAAVQTKDSKYFHSF